jgi:hypothetical protein
VTQASCRAKWEALNPGRKLTGARTEWTAQMKELLKSARHSQPHAAWLTIVNGDNTLKPIGQASRSS